MITLQQLLLWTILQTYYVPCELVENEYESEDDIVSEYRKNGML